MRVQVLIPVLSCKNGAMSLGWFDMNRRTPYIGIHMSDITPETAQLINRDSSLGFQVQETEGVLIVQVLPDTPAAAADLRQGDLIVEVEGQTITTAAEVQQLIANSRVGQSLSFTLQRHSQPITISVELGVLSAT